jgi:hypothetical protein
MEALGKGLEDALREPSQVWPFISKPKRYDISLSFVKVR